MKKVAGIIAVILSLGTCSSRLPSGTIVLESGQAPLNVIRPDRALGGAIDGLPAGQVETFFTDHNISAVRAAGLGPLSYSLRTDLAVDAWHWGEEGSWSDAAKAEGYWTSSDNPKQPVMTGWGYKLPRRGDSVDQAENNGYSRIDDDDPSTFWKSNPYLDALLSRAADRPQWVVIDFGTRKPISAARIVWAAPYAIQYRVQYWTGADPYDDEGHWRDFPSGYRTDGSGGAALLKLAAQPIATQFVRILLEKSSHRAPHGSHDLRDSLGYAIAEVGLGTLSNDGQLRDFIQHKPNGIAQTQITVSSTDPWHRASDRDPNAEQPGFDRIFRSVLSDNRPVLIPVGVLYDTPENAAAELRFLRRRGYPVYGVDVGEEPDGQNISPEDFGALYRQFGAALKAAEPGVRLGGPNLEDAIADTWLDDAPDRSWTRRFLRDITPPGGRPDLGFFSFEYYPFDTLCGTMDRKLVAADRILAQDFARLRDDGVPRSIPWVLTEYGFSAFSGRAEVELPGALFDADMLARFFSAGGSAAYFLGYGASQLYPPEQECAGYGELMLFGQDPHGQATWPTPAYWAIRLLAREWLQPGDDLHRLYRASLDLLPAEERKFVSAWPVLRPDGHWSVLLINRSSNKRFSTRLAFASDALRTSKPFGAWEGLQYDGSDYRWKAESARGHPMLDNPPHRISGQASEIVLPPYSITVVRSAKANG